MGYDEERQRLARKAIETLQLENGTSASMREFAEHAGTSVATLRHYFHDRQGLIRAAMEGVRADAAPYLAMATQPVFGDVNQSLLRFLSALATAWFKFGVGRLYAATLSVGLSARPFGPPFVDHVLEPLLQAGENLIRHHIERGELRVSDVRHASLVLLSPVVLALLHQDSLHGATCRPLDLTATVETQVETFLRAYGRT